MNLFCFQTFCGTSVICNTNLQTIITFFKNARVNKIITRKNLDQQKTRKWNNAKPRPRRRPTWPSPPRLVFFPNNSLHLLPSGRPSWARRCQPAPPLTCPPDAMDAIREPPRTPWTHSPSPSPPPPLSRLGEKQPRAAVAITVAKRGQHAPAASPSCPGAAPSSSSSRIARNRALVHHGELYFVVFVFGSGVIRDKFRPPRTLPEPAASLNTSLVSFSPVANRPLKPARSPCRNPR